MIDHDLHATVSGDAMATVGDIITVIEQIAGSHLAESWDNCGLQIGDRQHSVQRIVTALDPLPDVVNYACNRKADFLLTHHPFIFKPLARIDLTSPQGRIIAKAIEHKLAIYSSHTSYDCAKGGLNDVLARKLGLTGTTILGRPVEPEQMKLVIFVPVDYKDKILRALAETTAGIIGNYTCCSFSCEGQGRFRPGDEANPFAGHVGELSTEEELRIETVVLKQDAAKVIDHLASVHPYETMAYDLYPLVYHKACEGLGRIGKLEKPMALEDFVRHIKDRLGVDTVKAAGNLKGPVETVAVCSGSGSSMMGVFLKSNADVYVSGDLHYHDARSAEEANKAMVDVGHFASEIIMAEAMKESLDKWVRKKGFAVEVETCTLERDPFEYI